MERNFTQEIRMSTQSSGLFARLAQGSHVKQILVGLVLGILLAMVSKPAAEATGCSGPFSLAH